MSLGYTRSAMPTYEYVCRSCGHLFEVVQSMRDDALTECPECGGELRKVFAPPAISFKGSGFYATDHGKKAKTKTGPGTKTEGGEAKPSSSEGTGASSESGKGGGAEAGSSGTEAAKPATEPAAKPVAGGGSD
jgi:putative FmdB family regulatory protein